jgi:hypothetical protein
MRVVIRLMLWEIQGVPMLETRVRPVFPSPPTPLPRVLRRGEFNIGARKHSVKAL